jgi:hypothetical protein
MSGFEFLALASPEAIWGLWAGAAAVTGWLVAGGDQEPQQGEEPFRAVQSAARSNASSGMMSPRGPPLESVPEVTEARACGYSSSSASPPVPEVAPEEVPGGAEKATVYRWSEARDVKDSGRSTAASAT